VKRVKDIHKSNDRKKTSDSIADLIREDILNGTFKPSEKLKQEDLAARYGRSRAPIRDALIKLEAERIVKFNNGRYATVTPLNLKEFKDVYQIREVLEELAARLATPVLKNNIIDTLSGFADEMEAASNNLDLAKWIQLDKKFHLTFYESCPNYQLVEEIKKYWNQTHHFRWAYCTIPGRIKKAEKMHRRILASLKDRDSDTAAILVRIHIEESIQGILENKIRDAGGYKTA
jgi:DNA-binding GntR family transcriptional regulator